MHRLLIALGLMFTLVNSAPVLAQTFFTDNLLTFQAVVPDYSPSTGGYGPALSSDGETIAYTDTRGGIWILREFAGDGYKPWKLQYENPDGVTGPPLESGIRTFGRDVDWSPDGKKLVFADGDWRLHIAEHINAHSQSASVRPVTKIKSRGEDYYSVTGPRWSPDGKKIAFMRLWMKSDFSREPAQIWILDLETGTEAMVADDLSSTFPAWREPWSTDSKFLVYSAQHKDGNGKPDDHRPNIVVISLDGKTRRIVSDVGGGSSPSFHPKLNKIVYNGPVTYKIGCPGLDEGDFSLDKLWTVDSNGSNRRLACPSQEPNKLQLEQAAKKASKIAASWILDGLKDDITQQEYRKLRSGKLALSQVADIGSTAVARKIGGDFKRETENMLRASRKGPAAYKQAAKKFQEAMQKLPLEKQRIAYTYSLSTYSLAAMKGLLPFSRMCSMAVWSPDGSKLSFVRRSYLGDVAYCLNTKTGSAHPLIELGSVESTVWTTDSKCLIVQGRRILGIIEQTQEQRDKHKHWPSISGPARELGYPEIWMLQPK